MVSKRIDLSDKRPTLTSWLQSKMPQAQNLTLESLERSGAGLSNETFFIDLSWQEGSQSKSEKVVLRCPPSGFPVFPEYDLSKQFRIMHALSKTNVPVPKVYWLEEDESVLGTHFYVMGFTPGVIPPEYPPYHSFGMIFDATPEQRTKMWWSGVEAIAKIHAVDWEGLGLSFLGVPGPGTGPIDQELDYYENYLNWAKEEPQPILEAALKWLRDNKFTPKRVTLCWGDARLPNLILTPENEVAAVLDWEMAFLCDPECDVAWYWFLDWQHCEGYGMPRLEGFPSKEETLRRYEDLTGWKVENVDYYEVLAALKFGVVLLKLYKNFKIMGVAMPAEDAELNNVCTQRLAELLDLEPPGERQRRETTNLEDITATVQFHLTGPGGSDWYIVSDKGKASRHAGAAKSPNVTMTASAEDWEAIQRGEMDRIQAWTSGKLKIDGDMALLLQLEDTISKLREQQL
jgi:aminoglycoside phosphotransferase (APT) family kinase protein/putative sterol carrier protein